MVQERRYDPAAVESRWQTRWRESNSFEPSPARAGVSDTFVYSCTPFTTGKAHIGHIRSYSIADACARYARGCGDSVLWAMGFDAFGLPNEIAAIEHHVAPREWVDQCKSNMIAQFQRLGLSVDWSRCFDTSEASYYRWTQWVFLRFLERGLVYRANGVENWCAKCQCVLAALQVTQEHCCWRCGGAVTLNCIPQWYFRLLPYADELERGLNSLGGWDAAVLACQRTLFGKSSGIEVDLELPSLGKVPAFLVDTYKASEIAFVALSPNYPGVEKLLSRDRLIEIEAQRRRSFDREERRLKYTPAYQTGLTVSLDGVGCELPLVISSAVDTRFGGGAAFGAPTRDAIDAEIAAQLKISPQPELVGVLWKKSRPAVRYRLRDNSVSRQRVWGAPVPIIHCATCGEVPVPDSDLPVVLPQDALPTGEGSVLSKHPNFAECTCPSCGNAARRDTDTLDVHFDSIWMLVPFCIPSDDRATEMFTHPDLKRWLPVKQVVCGADQAGWWMNDRLFFRVMRDCGYFGHLTDAEPVRNLLMHEMVLADGRKMSKSSGNAVDPDELIRRYGADTLRLTVLKVNPRKAFSWSEIALVENFEFLSDLWSYIHGLQSFAGPTANTKLKRAASAAERRLIAAFESQAFHLVEYELKRLFNTLRRESNIADTVLLQAVNLLLRYLEPLAPHIASELLLVLDEKFRETSQIGSLAASHISSTRAVEAGLG